MVISLNKMKFLESDWKPFSISKTGDPAADDVEPEVDHDDDVDDNDELEAMQELPAQPEDEDTAVLAQLENVIAQVEILQNGSSSSVACTINLFTVVIYGFSL